MRVISAHSRHKMMHVQGDVKVTVQLPSGLQRNSVIAAVCMLDFSVNLQLLMLLNGP